MAILGVESNKVEVRIVRNQLGTYFDEYVKVGDREKRDATTCERYIIPDPGVIYSIRVTLKEGYQFGNADMVRCKMYLPGVNSPVAALSIFRPRNLEHDVLEEDIVKCIEYADTEVNGRKISGSRLVFRDISIDEELDDETDVMGIAPKELSSFRIDIVRMKWTAQRMTAEEEEYERHRYKAKAGQWTTASEGSKPWDVKKIDQDNYKKHGITTAVGFLGGQLAKVPAFDPYFYEADRGTPLTYHFHCRNAEFLEQITAVLYPPPLYCFPWEQLVEGERKLALKEIQEINKQEACGFSQTEIPRGREPAEWQHWNRMDVPERRAAYKKLQAAHKAYLRGEVKAQVVETPAVRIIDVEDAAAVRSIRRAPPTIEIIDSPPRIAPRKAQNDRRSRKDSTANIKQEVFELGSSNGTQTIGKRRRSDPVTQRIKKEVRIKVEPIDLDAMSDDGIGLLPEATIKENTIDLEDNAAKRVKLEEHSSEHLHPSRYTSEDTIQPYEEETRRNTMTRDEIVSQAFRTEENDLDKQQDFEMFNTSADLKDGTIQSEDLKEEGLALEDKNAYSLGGSQAAQGFTLTERERTEIAEGWNVAED